MDERTRPSQHRPSSHGRPGGGPCCGGRHHLRGYIQADSGRRSTTAPPSSRCSKRPPCLVRWTPTLPDGLVGSGGQFLAKLVRRRWRLPRQQRRTHVDPRRTHRTHHIGRVRIDPHRPDRMWVAALGELYSRTKEAASGTEMPATPGRVLDRGRERQPVVGAVDLVVDPSNPDTSTPPRDRTRRAQIHRGRGRIGVWESEDGGDTWTRISQLDGFPKVPRRAASASRTMRHPTPCTPSSTTRPPGRWTKLLPRRRD